ncbi:MAG: DNA methyltransferase, partial [Nitrososphaerales archaeon]
MSLAEVTSYLEAKGIDYRVTAFSKQAAIIDAAGLSIRDVMNRLGGLYKIGSAACVLGSKDVVDTVRMKEKLDSSEFYSWLDEKVRWCISIYRDEAGFDLEFPNFLQEYFKERLKKDGVKKARYILPKRTGEADQEVISDDLVKKRIVDEGLEILVAYLSGEYYIGRTLEVVRNQEFISRDLGRPFQNPKLSIPPKIARILVSLTGLKPGGNLLDPFCGIGTILQEAAVLGLKILGGDIDRQRVSETVKNLKWLSETYNLNIEN